MTANLEELLTRDGHLTELSLNRYLQGELESDAEEAVDTHMKSCEQCATLHVRVQAFDEELLNSPIFTQIPDFASAGEDTTKAAARAPELPPLRTPRHITGRKRWAQRRGLRAFLAVAAAAVFAILAYTVFDKSAEELLKPAPRRGGGFTDDIRIKGSGLGFRIHRQDVSGSVELGSGGEVYPGARLAFAVSPLEGGYIAVVGVDKRHNAYICSPTNGEAIWVEKGAKNVQLPGSVKLDEFIGEERIIAVHCAEPFAFDDIKANIEEGSRGVERARGIERDVDKEHNKEHFPLIREGCSQTGVVLKKVPPQE